MPIPRNAHRIWFGDPFPEKYLYYLANLRELNPGYKIYLWTDPSAFSKQCYEKLIEDCRALNVDIQDIRSHKDLLNYDIIMQELEAAKNNTKYKRLHYVRASDIARIAIKYKMGGIYTDTDTKMIKAFPDKLEPKHGIYIKHGTGHERFSYKDNPTNKDHRYFFDNVLYDFIAADIGNYQLKLSAEITRLDYETHQNSLNKDWEKSENDYIQMYGTVRLTGSALKWAINYSYQHDLLNLSDPNEILMDTDSFMQGDFDKSWLSDFNDNWANDPIKVQKFKKELETVLNPWLEEIEKARLISYPIKLLPNEIDKVKRSLNEMKNYNLLIKQIASNNNSITTRMIIEEFQKRDSTNEAMIEKFQARKLTEQQVTLRDYSIPDISSLLHSRTTLTLPSTFKVEFAKPQLTTFKVDFTKTQLTADDIRKIYKENGGSLLKQFSIFGFSSNTTEIIQALEERAKNNPDGASHKTLAEIRRK